MGDKCEKEAIHCTKYHNEKDKRRDVTIFSYSTTPCIAIWDDEINSFDFERMYCPDGDDCHDAHSTYEIIYHPTSYKVVKCPYVTNTGLNLCPLYKTKEWFKLRFCGHIHRFKRNTVTLKKETYGHKMRLALDYCPFAHDDKQKRSKDEPITWNIEDHIGKHPHRTWYSKQ